MARPPRGRDDEGDAERDAEVARLLGEATGLLPAGAELQAFRELLDAGDVRAAWDELRAQAEKRPTPFGFWVPMSKAGDLLGIP